MRITFIGFLVLFFCGIVFITETFAKKQQVRLQPVITYQDSTYTYQCTFQNQLPGDLLLQIFHKYDHIKHYVNKTNISTVLVEEEAERNIISYRYKYIVGAIQLTFNRKIDTASHRVTFDLLQSSSTSWLIPKALQTHGYYELSWTGDSQTVTYYQKTTLDRNLIWLYVRVINHETSLFLKELINYLDDVKEKADSVDK